MQQKSDTNKEFLDRFSALGVRLDLNTLQTCRKVGISRSLFYEIRDRKREVTIKMLERLAAAEKFGDPMLSRIEAAKATAVVQEGDRDTKTHVFNTVLENSQAPILAIDEALEELSDLKFRVARVGRTLALERVKYLDPSIRKAFLAEWPEPAQK
jgi:hypothetical protein